MLDSVHYSMANLETSPESELDLILGQLCALETQIDRELLDRNSNRESREGTGVHNNKPTTGVSLKPTMTASDMTLTTTTDNSLNGETIADNTSYNNRSHRRSGSGGGSSAEMQFTNGSRTDSPDNDSAYSDSLSMLSSERSEQSSSSGAGSSVNSSQQTLSKSNTNQTNQQKEVPNHPNQEQTYQTSEPTRAEKIKLALQKMREASIKKLFVKVFTADNSAKSLLADERMSVSVICRQLAEKNHIVMDPKCSIVEHIPELYLERFYEDNESLVENVLLWTRDSTNRLYFMEKEEKYDLFVCPEKYLLGADSSERDAQLDDEAKATLLEEFFSSGTVPVPEVEGTLFLKSDGKKCWKKHFFVLRASGLYYCPKGKSKSSKDLVCLTTFEMNNIYYGVGWRKKYKAPNDYGFAIKHPQIQAKNSKYIKYLCADSEQDMKLWTTGIRIAKYGRQLKDNYDYIMRDIMEADLDSLANRRSFSVCSMAKTLQVSPTSPINTCAPIGVAINGHQMTDRPMRPTSITITSNNGNNWNRISRHDSIRSSSTSSSSGCLSERGSNVSTPTMEQLAFEADFPVGTIKRKPSAMQPKIPLTSNTRNLVLQSDDALVEMDSDSSEPEDTGPHLQCGTLKSGTLRRSATDERLKTRIYEPLREQRFQNNNNIKLNDSSVQPVRSDDHIVDDLPLPPPPQVLQTSLSTLSLNSLPPPPSEVLESPDLGSNSTTPTAMSPVVSPKKSPQSPQVPPKPKLLRRMSETANDRKDFVNELKNRSNTLQRGLNSRQKLSPEVNSAISAYATSPRMRCGPYMQAMNSSAGPLNPNYTVNGSVSGGSEPQSPVNDVMIPSPVHQRSPIHYKPFPTGPPKQMQSHSPISASPLPPLPHQCYQSIPSSQPIYQSYGQQSRQSQPQQTEQSFRNSIQNQNNYNISENIFNFNVNHRQQQQYNSNVNKMGHQMPVQTQPYYPYPQNHQIYGTSNGAQQPALPMQQPMPAFLQQQQHCYQQMPNQYMGQQFQQHYQQQRQQPVQQMQAYSNQQPIYQSNPHSGANQHMINGQTYTKSKIYSLPPMEPTARSPHKGPLPPTPEVFLREIQRVMDKKWKVAQTLSSDLTATPNQILGFRDPRYLPPNSQQINHKHNNHMSNIYDVLPSRPAVKSVRISSQVNEIPVPKHYNNRRMAPTPPKRSEKTHLSGLV